MAHELEVWLFADRVGTLALVDGRCHTKTPLPCPPHSPCKQSRSTIAKRVPSLRVFYLKGKCAA